MEEKDIIMDIRGKFFAVGHGLTYAFVVDQAHVLFDINKKCDLIALQNFYGSKQIDVMIISHFDMDHMDGVKELYAEGFKIRKIYIPYITEDEKLIYTLMYITQGRNFEEEIAMLYDSEYDVVIEQVGDTTVFALACWQFDIYNSQGNAKSVIQKILTNLKSIGITSQQDVKNKLGTHTDDIVAAYKKVINDLNFTSMFMVHGPRSAMYVKYSCSNGKPFIGSGNPIRNNDSGHYHTLISGDCNLSNNRSILSHYIEMLAYALVPHHSGVKEWADYICKGSNELVWIVTISEISSRPYGKIVSDIYSYGDELFICDKKDEFEHIFFD